MFSRPLLAKLLQAAAALAFTAGVVTWVATGRHVGWTQTSTVVMQRDEITGIDYPQRRPGFVAGVEVPLAGSVLAAVALGLAGLVSRRPRQA
jgi:hypothetical protein